MSSWSQRRGLNPQRRLEGEQLKLALENRKPSLPKGLARADLLHELSSDMSMIVEASTAASGGARAANSFASSPSDTIKKTCPLGGVASRLRILDTYWRRKGSV